MSPRSRARAADATSEPAGLVLFPGAGASRDHSCLVAIERAVSPLPVLRADFAYRKAGRKAPDRTPVLLASVREEATAFAERLGVGTERLLLGGRSLGGRMCSIAVAEGLPAAGLVLVAYPLHPPGRPDQLRTAHLPSITVPCLFISGTRDAFGGVDELEAALELVRGPVTRFWLSGGTHDLKKFDAEVGDLVRDWSTALTRPPG